MEKRQHRRINFREPVTFQLKDPKVYGGCLSSDVSNGGIRVRLNEFMPLNTDMLLRIHTVDDKSVECMAKIVWVEQLPYSEYYQAGLAFSEVKPFVFD